MMKNLSKEQQTILLLLRRSLWGENVILPEGIDWAKIDTMAQEQGVTAFIYDGVRDLRTDIPEQILQKWLRKLIAGVSRNEKLMRAQDEIVRWFADADIPAAILKGSSVSRYYPQPDLRALGDIDILVANSKLEKAKKILEHNGYVLYENDPGYHISFRGSGIHVELHYGVTQLPDSEGGHLLENVTADLLDEIDQGRVAERTFPVLSESNQALALLLHMIRHMFGSGIGLRQVCDWMMCMAHMDPEVFINTTLPILEHCGLLRYAKIATSVCVCYLGLAKQNVPWCDDVPEEECLIFIGDVFCEGNMGTANKDGMGSLFTYSRAMGTRQSSLGALLVRLTNRAYEHYPIMKKLKFLLPVAWVYLPVRIMIGQLLGTQPKRSIVKATKSAKKRRELYEMLRLFQIEK